jgi:hypothetical protein
MAPVVWRYSTTEDGEPYVRGTTGDGVFVKLKWHVVILDIIMLLELFVAAKFLTVLDRYGWIMSDVLEMNTV